MMRVTALQNKTKMKKIGKISTFNFI